MKQSVALTKWCPFVQLILAKAKPAAEDAGDSERVVMVDTDVFVSNRGAATTEMTSTGDPADLIGIAHCIGGSCMAWRWSTANREGMDDDGTCARMFPTTL